MAVTELSSALSIAVASDGKFLYTHSRAGLFKIGTGKSGSTHGMVYAAVRGFRGQERSTLACFGNYLYYRSPAIAPAIFLVLSTEYGAALSLAPCPALPLPLLLLRSLPLILSHANPWRVCC
jgi:hypothetical protein